MRAGTRAGRNSWPCRPHRALRPGRSPGTNSPPDCLCPGSPSRLRRCAPPPTRPRLCRTRGCAPPERHRWCLSGGRCLAGALYGAARSGRLVARARTRAHQHLTHGRLFERSERSERSEFCRGATSLSTAAESERSADRPILRPCQAPPAATRDAHPGIHGAGRLARNAANPSRASSVPRTLAIVCAVSSTTASVTGPSCNRANSALISPSSPARSSRLPLPRSAPSSAPTAAPAVCRPRWSRKARSPTAGCRTSPR
jgi:hypothetical protein